jgi:hypothetical protein
MEKHTAAGEGWQSVQVMEPLTPKLRTMEVEPVRPKQELKPVKTWQTGAKSWMVDFGEVLHGIVKLNFNEPAGTVIRIHYAEHARPSEMLNVPAAIGGATARRRTTSSSATASRAFSRSIFHQSFRYAEITGLSREPAPGDFTAWCVHSDVKTSLLSSPPSRCSTACFENGIRTHENYLNHMFGDLPRERCLWGAESIYTWVFAFNGADAAPNHRLMARLWLTGRMTPDGVPGSIGVGKRITTATHSFI